MVSIGLASSGIGAPLFPTFVIGGTGGNRPPAAGAGGGGTSVSTGLVSAGIGDPLFAKFAAEAPTPAPKAGASPSASLDESGMGLASPPTAPGGGGGAKVSADFLSSSGGKPPGAVGGGNGTGGSIGLSPDPTGMGGVGGVAPVSPAAGVEVGAGGGGGIKSPGPGTGAGGIPPFSAPLAEASTTSLLPSIASGAGGVDSAVLTASTPDGTLASLSALATCSVGALCPSNSSGET